ncbi:hypothetical protein SODALDRAFT_334999 [Sodiomyces alkalinus F11]|uniref:F-box domain-containing protein n=1 Tax=Sodiomyces alkalinus (strain CBS 110278 / VKM F-3762 / F11) TaxID=1314773 RepID=A0A3N2PQR3_SODAK|nr:hypothetical protein SODALDRAFT_334999 [Sodiomyces alkalinus F11]ROT36800.1 hypothetical protein SODALDRAFT_334999 [Sodiomyces alkalinus F11]
MSKTKFLSLLKKAARPGSFAPNVEPQGETTAPCPLLELPLDLVALIADHLPAENQLVLAQTCRALRRTVLEINLYMPEHRRGGDFVGHVLREESARRAYLSLLNRDQMNRVLCAKCRTLYPVNYRDTPHTPINLPCPLTRKYSTPCTVLLSNNFGGPAAPVFKHIHVQTALKYVRNWDILNSVQRDYAERVLGELHSTDLEGDLNVRCSVYPKIVEDTAETHPERRINFLVKTVYTYRMGTRPVTAARLSDAIQTLYHFNWIMSKSLADDDSDPSSLSTKDPSPLLHQLVPEVPPQAFWEDDGDGVTGACSHCPTEYLWKTSFGDHLFQTEATLCIWSYLGNEESMEAGSAAKQCHISHSMCTAAQSPRFSVPGSVKRLYEGHNDALSLAKSRETRESQAHRRDVRSWLASKRRQIAKLGGGRRD